jgi:predicted anti-sigma-YlaC factor YlaD
VALSARLDGEAETGDPAATDAHLDGCYRCRAWLDDAARLRRLLTFSAVGTPGAAGRGRGQAGAAGRSGQAGGADQECRDGGVDPAILAAAPGPGRRRLALALRIGLCGVGMLQVLLGAAQVGDLAGAASGHQVVPGLSPEHLWHESAAWNVAVGAGFLWAAPRRARPTGLLPVVAAFLATLAMVSVDDLIAGQVAWARLASHLPVAVGSIMVIAIGLPALDFTPPPTSRIGTRWRRSVSAGCRDDGGRGTPGHRDTATRRCAAGPPVAHSDAGQG